MRAACVLLLIAGICGDIETCRALDGAAHLACSADGQSLRVALPADGRDLAFRSAADAWIEIREQGLTITVAGDGADESIDIPRPLRFGYHWLHVAREGEFQVRRFDAGTADGGIAVAAHCDPSPALQQRVDWIRRAGRLSAHAAESDPHIATQQLDESRALVAAADDAETTALALHLVAQTLLVSGRNSEATDAFFRAAEAWTRAGKPDSALAARVGYISELVLSGSNQAALAATEAPERLTQPLSYLLVRLEYERCVALQNLDRLDDADGCYGWVLASYKRLREDSEYFLAMQAVATVKRDRGDFDGAERLFERSLREVKGPYAHSTRGRNLLSLADVSLRRGEVARAMQQLNAALEEFTLYKSPRWQGNVYMKLADLYGELGSYDEAYSALAQAVRRFSARDDAPRFATAILSFASLERLNGHDVSALCWAAMAEAMFRSLGLPGRAGSARLLVSMLRAEGALPVLPNPPPPESALTEDAGQWRLVRAQLAVAQGSDDALRDELEQLARLPLRLSDRVRATTLDAKRKAAGGDAAGAQSMLIEETARIDALAAHARSDVLRLVITRESRELRRAGLQLLLEHDAAPETTAAAVWFWLAGQADAREAQGPRGGDAARDDAFGRAVANELLVASNDRAGPAADAAAQRELLARLAGSGHDRGERSAATPGIMTLQQFRATLPEGSAFAAYVDGGPRGAVLWVTRDDARLLTASAPEQVRTDTFDLQAAARDSAASLAAVQDAAMRLAADWFGAAGAAPPRRLYVLSDANSRSVPWSVLPWPGTTTPLLESTAVTRVRLSRAASSGAGRTWTPQAIQVAVSAQREAAGGALPALGGAQVEATQIRAAAGGMRVVEDARATRESVGRALSDAGGWIHVAAHGVAEPQRIGYAGLWLEPDAAQSSPTFLSWIDVLDQGVQSELVVLDACQSGDSGSAVNGYLSFADAVARAGAHRVVAVMWPASDAAAATWVPAFYGALLADAKHDAADALRNAQLRLRASRAFAHPFYWAGMQTIERWPIGVAAAH